MQIRRLSAWSWLTGGKLVGPEQFLVVVLAALACRGTGARDAEAGRHRAAIDVSVATLWKAPNLYRAIDRPSVGNPVDPVRWSDNLSTTASRVWLDSHVQTQALYAQTVTVLALRGALGEGRGARRARPAGRARLSGLAAALAARDGLRRDGPSMVVVARTAVVRRRRRPHAHAELRHAAAR